MNNQETPIKDQQQPLSQERSVHVDEREAKPAELAPSFSGEHHARPATPPPSNPYGPPYTWPPYTPGIEPHWQRGQGQPRFSYPRRRSSWPWIVLAFVLLFMLLTGGTFFALYVAGYNFTGYTQSISETRQFSVNSGPNLVLNNDTGSIHVRALASQNAVTIQATKHTGLWGNLNDLTVTYAQDTQANTITVNVDRQNNFLTSTSVEFDVSVPALASLHLKTNTGSIDVSGVSGQILLTSNTGSISASNGRLNGNSGLVTNTGSVTFSGSIDPNGTYRFETNTGSVGVTLPADSAFHVDASTDTGSINTNFPGVIVQHHQFTGAEVHSDVGSSPQTMISLKTNTGSINLNER